mmetsp:Transcript_17919/g.35016  ORF Transcript_17919/g.35016 Transcript_17919/m.35016 type:complete len:81 (+) Transcript_17919:27-269(+)
MKVNYYDAFVPSMILGKNFSNSLKQTSFTLSKFPIAKKNNFNKKSFVKKKTLTLMKENSSSTEEYMTILNEEFVSHEKKF